MCVLIFSFRKSVCVCVCVLLFFLKLLGTKKVDSYNTSYTRKILIKDLKVKSEHRHEYLYKSLYLHKPSSRTHSLSTKLKTESTGIPSSPEVRTWCFHCQVWVQSLARELRLYEPHGQKQTKKRQKA